LSLYILFKLSFCGDGIGGFATVDKSVSLIGRINSTLLNNGKADAASSSGRLTQSLSARLPLLFHPEPEKVIAF